MLQQNTQRCPPGSWLALQVNSLNPHLSQYRKRWVGPQFQTIWGPLSPLGRDKACIYFCILLSLYPATKRWASHANLWKEATKATANPFWNYGGEQIKKLQLISWALIRRPSWINPQTQLLQLIIGRPWLRGPSLWVCCCCCAAFGLWGVCV